jgi:hypothetical protein
VSDLSDVKIKVSEGMLDHPDVTLALWRLLSALDEGGFEVGDEADQGDKVSSSTTVWRPGWSAETGGK